MQYYSLHYATKHIGRGVFPQSRDIELETGRTVNDHDFAWQLRGDAVPDFKPYIGTILLQKGAAVTDFISSATITKGFICNDKVKGIVEHHHSGNTRFYEMAVKHRDIYYHNYWLMHCVNNYADRVDFDKSTFCVLRIENNTRVGKQQMVKSFAEYRNLSDNLWKNTHGDWRVLEPMEIRFKDNYKPEHDLFLIWGLTYKTYVSERLRNAFEKNEVKGVQYDFDGAHVDFE